MTTGTGIALLGIWGFAACCAVSRYVTGVGFWIGVIAALGATLFVVSY